MYTFFPSVKQYRLTKSAFPRPAELVLGNPSSFPLAFAKLQRESARGILPAPRQAREGERENLSLLLDPSFEDEGYSLVAEDEGFLLVAKKESGLLFAISLLKQVFLQAGKSIETFEVHDWPDLSWRGFMLDVSRDKIPTYPTLLSYVTLLSDLRMNNFELYFEGFSYEFSAFAQYLTKDGYLTREEYAGLEEACIAEGIDFIPNANGFGHMMDILRTDEYHDLAECPGGINRWGAHRDASTLDPEDPRSLELVAKIYDDLLPGRKSAYFNMNFDEPFELGKGKSKAIVAKKGLGNVYIDYVLKVLPLIQKHDKTPLIWCDVLVNHPELLYRLPRNMIFLEWGYEGNHPWRKHLSLFRSEGVPFIAACGTSSWCSFVGRTQEWLDNITTAAMAVKEEGGLGLILTDWGDCGHPQFLPTSILPIAYAAAMSWNVTGGQLKEATAYADRYIFHDPTRIISHALLAEGRTAEVFGYRSNGTRLFYDLYFIRYAMREESPVAVYRRGRQDYPTAAQVTILEESIKALESAIALSRPADPYVKSEMRQSLRTELAIAYVARAATPRLSPVEKERLITLALSMKDEIMAEQERLWFARNRTGNLKHSLEFFQTFFAFAEILKNYPR